MALDWRETSQPTPGWLEQEEPGSGKDGQGGGHTPSYGTKTQAGGGGMGGWEAWVGAEIAGWGTEQA